jgi:hypothetical protein
MHCAKCGFWCTWQWWCTIGANGERCHPRLRCEKWTAEAMLLWLVKIKNQEQPQMPALIIVFCSVKGCGYQCYLQQKLLLLYWNSDVTTKKIPKQPEIAHNSFTLLLASSSIKTGLKYLLPCTFKKEPNKVTP